MKRISNVSIMLMFILIFTACVKPPQACFVQDTIGQEIKFTSDCSKFGKDFSWNFGDGTTSTEASPWHNYEKTGDYTVTLVVQNKRGKNTIKQEAEFEEYCNSCRCKDQTVLFTDSFCGYYSQKEEWEKEFISKCYGVDGIILCN